jgi:tRNA(Ile)-lysidine synthase
LEQRVLARLKRLCLPPESRTVVGFSGGPDSLALAAILARLQPVSGAAVTLVHVDHGLRPESAEDAVRCRRLAGGLGLPFVVVRLADGLKDRHSGVGIEEAARRERYVALASEAAAEGTDVVAIGHHLEDQAETVLLHLLRGSGLSGATGMAELSSLTVPWWLAAPGAGTTTLRLWRPLLDEPRDLVRAYAAATGLTPLRDSTNDELLFRRNRLRHQIMPMLRAIDPGADAALARYARIARDEDALLSDLARRALSAATRDDGGLDIGPLGGEHLAVQRRVVRSWLDGLGAPAGLALDRIDAVLVAAGEKRGERLIEIGEGWSVLTDGRALAAVAPARQRQDNEGTYPDDEEAQ